jgi:hypothetical protein
MNGELPARRVFRRLGWNLLAVSVSSGYTVIAASGIFFADTGEPGVMQRTMSTAATLVGIVLTFRVARLAIVATPDRLVVRNIFRSYTVLWGEIASIDPPKMYGSTRKTGIVVTRKDGSSLSATAYVRGPHNRDTFGDSVTNDLRKLAASAARR